MPDFDQGLSIPGDVMFYSPSDVTGIAISVFTGELLSHVEVSIGNGKVVAARIEGVNVYDFRADRYLAYVRRPEIPEFNLNGGITAVQPEIGQGYDIGALVGFVNPWRKHKKVIDICSPIVTLFERGGGVQPFNDEVEASQISPADLFKSPALKTIWTRDDLKHLKKSLSRTAILRKALVRP
jgi:hypothetical protein